MSPPGSAQVPAQGQSHDVAAPSPGLQRNAYTTSTECRCSRAHHSEEASPEGVVKAGDVSSAFVRSCDVHRSHLPEGPQREFFLSKNVGEEPRALRVTVVTADPQSTLSLPPRPQSHCPLPTVPPPPPAFSGWRQPQKIASADPAKASGWVTHQH